MSEGTSAFRLFCHCVSKGRTLPAPAPALWPPPLSLPAAVLLVGKGCRSTLVEIESQDPDANPFPTNNFGDLQKGLAERGFPDFF